MFFVYSILLLLIVEYQLADSQVPRAALQNLTETSIQSSTSEDQGCNCGIFLTGQFVKGSSKPPNGDPAIVVETSESFSCDQAGMKQCMEKCLDNLVEHLQTSTAVICASVDRDTFKERAHLFIKICNKNWQNTYLSAGKEYCCRNGTDYKCPIN